MKKFKFLILIVYLALLVTGVGYAYWSDSLIVNNTVTTGELSVRFEDGSLNGLKFSDLKASKYVLDADTAIKIGNDNSIVTDNNTAAITIPHIYPGSWAAFRLKAINSGTIPVKITDIKFSDISKDTELLSYLTFEGGIGIDADGNGTIDKYNKFSGSLSEVEKDINEWLSIDMKNTEIIPKGGIYFYIPEQETAPDLDEDGTVDRFNIIRFKSDAPCETQNKSVTFKFTMNFKQFNAN